jgi:hypothetical protein
MPAKRTAAKKSTSKKTTAKKKSAATSPRKSGGEVDAYLAQQPPEKRALLEKLRAIVERSAPDATPAIKWGVPIYARNGKNICALASFKESVAINFFAPAELFVDPGKKLEGSGKGQRMLKVRSAADIDAASIQRWLKVAVAASS